MVRTDRTELGNAQIEGGFFFLLISSYQILRQFEALMGGSLHAPRQDAANSGHQATMNQLPTSTYSDPFIPTHSSDNINLNHYQPDISPTGVTNPPNHPSPPPRLALAQRDSSGELMDDSDEEKRSPTPQELEQHWVEPIRTAEAESVDKESELNTDRSSSPPPVELQSEQPCLSRLSLFSGMELVMKGKRLCERETSPTQTDVTDESLRESLTVHSSLSISKTSDDAPSPCNSVASDSSQPVSAFSFLNF